jgi:hypothetical protein
MVTYTSKESSSIRKKEKGYFAICNTFASMSEYSAQKVTTSETIVTYVC